MTTARKSCLSVLQAVFFSFALLATQFQTVGQQSATPSPTLQPLPPTHLLARATPWEYVERHDISTSSTVEYTVKKQNVIPETSNASEISKRYWPVAVSHGNWFDATRNRSVLIKIYWPVQFPGKCPVIIFSHGLGGSNEKCAYLGQAWASQGFVSVHVQHPGLDEQVWKRKIRPVKELKDVYSQHWSGRTQANDVRFVLDQLDILAANGTPIGKLLDMTRVGVAGYDLGGLAAMLLAGQQPPDRGSDLCDPRIKAIVVMSPPVADQATFVPVSYGAMSTPALFFTGTEDNGVVGSTKSWQRRIPFDYMMGNDRFLITYQDADHLIYGGHVLPTRSRDDQKYQANVTQASSLFWRAYLRGEPAVYAYFQGRSLGGIAGTLGRVERRLGGNSVMTPVVAVD